MPEKNVKKRNWALVAYPESLPADWLQILADTGLQVAVSPLHDSDVNPDGEKKKAHYHLILCYPGPQTYNAVKSLADSLHCPIPKPLESIRGAYRYFTHMDNPEKFQYDAGRIQCLNGFCITDYVELTKSEVLRIKQDLQGFIRAQNILEYSDLMDTLQDDGNADYYDVASSNTYFFEKYITSRRNKSKQLAEWAAKGSSDAQ